MHKFFVAIALTWALALTGLAGGGIAEAEAKEGKTMAVDDWYQGS